MYTSPLREIKHFCSVLNWDCLKKKNMQEKKVCLLDTVSLCYSVGDGSHSSGGGDHCGFNLRTLDFSWRLEVVHLHLKDGGQGKHRPVSAIFFIGGLYAAGIFPHPHLYSGRTLMTASDQQDRSESSRLPLTFSGRQELYPKAIHSHIPLLLLL